MKNLHLQMVFHWSFAFKSQTWVAFHFPLSFQGSEATEIFCTPLNAACIPLSRNTADILRWNNSSLHLSLDHSIPFCSMSHSFSKYFVNKRTRITTIYFNSPPPPIFHISTFLSFINVSYSRHPLINILHRSRHDHRPSSVMPSNNFASTYLAILCRQKGILA